MLARLSWLERLGRIGLVHCAYKPGVENVAADVLSCFGQHVEQEHDVSISKHSLALDVACCMLCVIGCKWLLSM